MIFTVIMPYFYLLLCHKPIRNILQREGAFPYCLITYFFVLKWSGTWHSYHGSASTALIHISWVLKWSGTHANERRLSSAVLIHISCVLYWSITGLILDNLQHPWHFFNNFFTHLLGLKVISEVLQSLGIFSTALSHISSVLKWSGTCLSMRGSSSTALIRIPGVLKWSGTCLNMRGLSATASLHISCVSKRSGIIKNGH